MCTDRAPTRDDAASEIGQLLSEYKKHLRDGEAHRLFIDRVSEELCDWSTIIRFSGGRSS